MCDFITFFNLVSNRCTRCPTHPKYSINFTENVSLVCQYFFYQFYKHPQHSYLPFHRSCASLLNITSFYPRSIPVYRNTSPCTILQHQNYRFQGLQYDKNGSLTFVSTNIFSCLKLIMHSPGPKYNKERCHHPLVMGRVESEIILLDNLTTDCTQIVRFEIYYSIPKLKYDVVVFLPYFFETKNSNVCYCRIYSISVQHFLEI